MLCFQNFNGLWHELVLMHNGTYSIHNEMNVCTHFILEYKFILKVNLALDGILFKKGRSSVTFFSLIVYFVKSIYLEALRGKSDFRP